MSDKSKKVVGTSLITLTIVGVFLISLLSKPLTVGNVFESIGETVGLLIFPALVACLFPATVKDKNQGKLVGAVAFTFFSIIVMLII